MKNKIIRILAEFVIDQDFQYYSKDELDDLINAYNDDFQELVDKIYIIIETDLEQKRLNQY